MSSISSMKDTDPSKITSASGIQASTSTITSIKVSSDVIRSQQAHDPLMSKTEVRRVEIKDVLGVLRPTGKRNDLQGVTQEQIDRVRQMHDRFAEGAEFSFNYNTLLLVASVLAGLGLASASTTTVIASMLVSPIMGPVVGIAYGQYIQDRQMVVTALKTELFSLLFCIAVGACIGGCMGWTDTAESWPTPDMVSRCTWANFFVGLPIAFFSGLGVAVSLLDEQTNSLVGVAISASLLPPAVNAGLVWVAYGFFEKNRSENDYDLSYDDVVVSGVTRDDFRSGGVVSLLLTLANIVLVIVASIFMFRLKEKLPIKKKVFWEELRIARLIYQDRAYLVEGEMPLNGQLSNESLADTHVLPGAIPEQQPLSSGEEPMDEAVREIYDKELSPV